MCTVIKGLLCLRGNLFTRGCVCDYCDESQSAQRYSAPARSLWAFLIFRFTANSCCISGGPVRAIAMPPEERTNALQCNLLLLCSVLLALAGEWVGGWDCGVLVITILLYWCCRIKCLSECYSIYYCICSWSTLHCWICCQLHLYCCGHIR